MTEEEEKAIEWLRNKPRECTSLINSCSYIENKKAYAKDRTMFKTIINIIKSQQKEIENKDNKIWQLKSQIQDLENECISLHELIDEEI